MAVSVPPGDGPLRIVVTMEGDPGRVGRWRSNKAMNQTLG
jgi:hypothetical protein